MMWGELLKKLQKLSPEQLKEEVVLSDTIGDGDGGEIEIDKQIHQLVVKPKEVYLL